MTETIILVGMAVFCLGWLSARLYWEGNNGGQAMTASEMVLVTSILCLSPWLVLIALIWRDKR